jgi:hypothetical protein
MLHKSPRHDVRHEFVGVVDALGPLKRSAKASALARSSESAGVSHSGASGTGGDSAAVRTKEAQNRHGCDGERPYLLKSDLG